MRVVKVKFVVFDYLLYALVRNYLQEGGLTELLKVSSLASIL